MSYQDRDIAKLKKFANSFGLRIYYRRYTRYTDAALYQGGQFITIFVSSTTSKTEIILSLLHELGHHIDWIFNKRNDRDTQKAYTEFEAKDHKKYSKIILDLEKEGIKHMTTIHKLLELEIPLKLVKQQQKIDTFHYDFFYKHARPPTVLEGMAYEMNVRRMK